MTYVRSTLLLLAALLVPLTAAAQSSEPVVETDPAIPTVAQPVTVFFNADQGSRGLEDFTGEVYAHTGIYTSESPSEWKCVKNFWPTESDFPGERSDTRMERVDANRYSLTIDNVRDYYLDTNTECNLAPDEEIQSINFVFRNTDGSLEGKTQGGNDIIIDVASGEPGVNVSIESPAVSAITPFVTDTDQTVQVRAVANAIETSVERLSVFVDDTEVASTTATQITYDLVLDQPGRVDVRVEARGEDGSADADAFYAVRTEPTTEASVPSGTRDGITENGASVTFVLEAPGKDFVHLIGDFNGWEVRPEFQLQRESGTTASGQQSDRFWIQIDTLRTGVEYGFQYLVDGEIRIADPYSEKVLSTNDSFISNETYPNLKPYPTGKTEQLVGVFELGESPFSFRDFARPEQKDLVIYELLVRDFIENHDYATLTDTLDYLDRMGINAIELMPVSEFDGNQSWGYNPAMYFAPDKFYGPEEDLKRFIDEAHRRGMAVILDVVYNQATGQSPFVRLFNDGTFGAPTTDNPWVNREARHPFNVFNDNNHDSDLTKRWLDRANEYWLTEFNVDGFRFDLSKGFTQTDTGDDVGAWGRYDQSRVDILTRMADEIWSVDDRAYVILEHFAEPDEEKVLAEYRTGEGLPGMMLWNNVHGPYNQVSMGYASDSDLSNTYFRNRGIDVPNYVTYMESHDEQWMMYNNIANGNATPDGSYDVTNLPTALNRQKLAGALFFTVPGPRMMWQFGELGYGYGDDGTICLRDNNCPADAPGRTDPKPILWDYRDPAQSPNRVALYETWSALINLRQNHEVFRSPDTEVDLRVGSGETGKRIVLRHPTMDVVVVGNTGVQARAVEANFPTAGPWYDYFTGQSIDIDEGEEDGGILMAPGQFHIFTSTELPTPKEGLVPFAAAAPAPSAPGSPQASTTADASAITVTWAASEAPDVTGYRVYRGTSAGFDTTGAAVATVAPDVTSYTDTDVEAGIPYRYRIAATDDDGQTSPLSSEVDAVLYPQQISFQATRSFGEGTREQDYRLVSLPGDIQRDLAETFSGTAGTDWQAYWDDGSDDDFLIAFDGSDTFTFVPGRGFWAISTSDWSVGADVPTVALTTEGSVQGYEIDLNVGWNIIANPFDRDVPWSAVQAANAEVGPLWQFNGTYTRTETMASARSGEAYYYNNTRGAGRLTIPYASTVSSSAGASSSAKSAPSYLTLTATTSDGLASMIEVGTRESAVEGVGPEDVVAPPSRFDALRLRLPAQDATVGTRQQSLARSVRPPSQDGQVFDLTLTAASEGRVQIAASGLQAVDAAEVRLVDRETGASYDLRAEPSVDVRVEADIREMTLLTGSRAFVDREQERLLPETLRLWPNFPNPFRGQTTLEYTLPEPGHVTLEVYDVLGRRVTVLVDGRRKAGLHTVTWNAARTRLASGLYLTRLTANGASQTQKMILVR